MEFRLNKIDTELRQRVQDASKSGVVHRKNEIKTNQQKKQDNSNKRTFKYKLKKIKDNEKKIKVNTHKFQKVAVDAFKEETDNFCKDRGLFIDIKK